MMPGPFKALTLAIVGVGPERAAPTDRDLAIFLGGRTPQQAINSLVERGFLAEERNATGQVTYKPTEKGVDFFTRRVIQSLT